MPFGKQSTEDGDAAMVVTLNPGMSPMPFGKQSTEDPAGGSLSEQCSGVTNAFRQAVH